MSLFGGQNTGMNVYGFSTNKNIQTSSLDVTSLLLNLFDTIETIEDTIVNLLIKGDELGITPELKFRSISVRASYTQLLSRRLYFQNGFELLPDGSCDCRTLRRLYREHPVLRLYSFEEFEPRCCE